VLTGTKNSMPIHIPPIVTRRLTAISIPAETQFARPSVTPATHTRSTTPLPQRRNIHDNDEFDRLGSSSLSKLTIGRRANNTNADTLLAAKSELPKSAIFSALAAFDSFTVISTTAGFLWCGLVYLTAAHTPSLRLAFSRKLLQQAFFARLVALRRSRRAALVALVLFDRSARLALLGCFLSSEIPASGSVGSHSLVWRTHQGRPAYLVSTTLLPRSPITGLHLSAASSHRLFASARTSSAFLALPGCRLSA